MNDNIENIFIGKTHVINSLKIEIKAAEAAHTPFSHVLFYGPPGVGKTSLAIWLSKELNVGIKVILSSNIHTTCDLNGIIASMNPGDLLFLDEVHSLKREIVEILYPIMDGKNINIFSGFGMGKRSLSLKCPSITIIAATTEYGEIPKSLEERFNCIYYLDEYSNQELEELILFYADQMKLSLSTEDIFQIISNSRKIPRNAIRILKKIGNHKLANSPLSVSQIIKECGFVLNGLTELDIKYLKAIQFKSNSLLNISYKLNVNIKTIVNKIEPFLFSEELIIKTSRGREITEKGRKILKSLA